MNLKYLTPFICLLISPSCQPQKEAIETKEAAIVDTLASLANQFSRAYMDGDVAS